MVESKPRIIVTGFETDPGEVYAGDTFMVTIHVKNTSQDQAVTNVLFDMQAVESGTEANTTYAVFLPTSGSSSVYTERIGAGMKELHIDIESYSSADLGKCGVYKYAEAEDFEILLFAYSEDGKEVKVVDLAKGKKIPHGEKIHGHG